MRRDVWPFVVLGLLLLATRKRKGSAPMSLSPNQFAPGVRAWEVPLITNGSEGIAPISFLLSWIAVESGGNWGAVGLPTAQGGKLDSSGFPWEVSIWQLDPGNRAVAGFTAAQLRPGCAVQSGTRAEVEACSRPLTGDEIKVQVQAGMNYVRFCRRKVDAALLASSVPWLYPSVDYLRAVKSVHGSPEVVDVGVRAATRVLGRVPADFEELATVLRANRALLPDLDVRFPGGETMLDAVLSNAMKTAR